MYARRECRMSDTSSPASLLQAATEIARTVSATAMRWYRSSDFEVEKKSDGSPVTIADREGERVAREWIAQRYPRDGILGEEFGDSRPDAKRRWIVDPIDGTKAFVRGVPLWGTLVACCEGDVVLAGAACYPAVHEMIAAAPGEGCWWNDSRAHVSGIERLSDATLLTTDSRFPERAHRADAWRELAAQVAVCRTWGDCYGYLLVATGRAEAMVDDIVNPWDAAALQPIIEEAGGVFTSWRGVKTAFGGDLIATNLGVAGATRRILQEKQ
jgi:histidinol phosphatase-like enzyme (inositol monophosphatase family)